MLHALQVWKKHFLAHVKLFKKFLTIFWTTKTGGEMVDSLALAWTSCRPLTKQCAC